MTIEDFFSVILRLCLIFQCAVPFIVKCIEKKLFVLVCTGICLVCAIYPI